MKDRILPTLFNKKEECCGCTACYAVCSKAAIVMKADNEGFEYPTVIAEKCVLCYQCLTVCPLKRKEEI